ncbi:MAG: hypothetical protein A4E19_16730 [Nitrospira sp. SG-bin1]|nr:MAG: hypothetical protein A4E19_16730 [Nitrospira sp. SG-bin1]
MKRSHMAMVVAGFLIYATGCVEMQRTCTSQEMIAMKEKGFSVDDIDNMCTSYKVKEESFQAVADVMKAMAANPKDQSNPAGSGPANAAAFSNAGAAYCTTQYGSCPLGTRAAAGLMCQCQTVYGPIPGVTQ